VAVLLLTIQIRSFECYERQPKFRVDHALKLHMYLINDEAKKHSETNISILHLITRLFNCNFVTNDAKLCHVINMYICQKHSPRN
jgi:hypothetical protein